MGLNQEPMPQVIRRNYSRYVARGRECPVAEARRPYPYPYDDEGRAWLWCSLVAFAAGVVIWAVACGVGQ